MPFRTLRYHADAEPGLEILRARGAAVFDALKQRLRTIQAKWDPGEPENEDDAPQLLVAFDDHYLLFTISEHDPTVLVLADVQQQPRG